MYRVLYRKWRPQVFSDVVGQPQVTKTLLSQVQENRLSHAYLFTGSRGTGKTTCAKILSKAVNCLSPQNGDPCNQCEICRGIDNGTVLDIVEIDAASNRGIDDIRLLRDEVSFTPSQAKYRVYIIDEVHMLTIEAFNALLKTLEEPPEHVKFILATTEVHKLPATILSRCQRFDFRRIEPDIIAQRLLSVAKAEGIDLHTDAAMLIARIADGGMRDALSLLDRASSESSEVTASAVSASAGLMGREYIYKLMSALAQKDTAQCLLLTDELHRSGCDTQRLCTELTEQFRNFLMIKTVQHPEQLIICTDEELTKLKDYANSFSKDQILYSLSVLNQTAESMKRTQNRRVELEMALIRLCVPGDSTEPSALNARISALEQELEELKKNEIWQEEWETEELPLTNEARITPDDPLLPLQNEYSPAPQKEYTPAPTQEAYIPAPTEKEYTPAPTEEEYIPKPPAKEYTPAPTEEEYIPEPPEEEYIPEPPDWEEPFSEDGVPGALVYNGNNNNGQAFPQTDFSGFHAEPRKQSYADRFSALNQPLEKPFSQADTSAPPPDDFDYYQFMEDIGFPDDNNQDASAPLPAQDPPPIKTTEQKPAPPADPFAAPFSGETDRKQLDQKTWLKIVAQAEMRFNPLIGLLETSTAELSGETIWIKAGHPMAKKLIQDFILTGPIAEAAKAVLGKAYTIRLHE